MNVLLRIDVPFLGALVAGALSPAHAPAQSYPTRPITMIVPFPASGLTDVPARVPRRDDAARSAAAECTSLFRPGDRMGPQISASCITGQACQVL